MIAGFSDGKPRTFRAAGERARLLRQDDPFNAARAAGWEPYAVMLWVR
jgi:hypothetical protein